MTHPESGDIIPQSKWQNFLRKPENFLIYLQWAGTASLFIGALLLSIYPEMGKGVFIFYLFFIGHVFFIIDCYIGKMPPYLALNFGFLALDIAGIIVRL